MEVLSHLGAILSPTNVAVCFAGVLVGTVVGVLPGLGPITTMALVLPMSFGWPPETALILLAGMWYGAQYGGSTTSILLKVPGEVTSIMTCLDGYAMAQKGRAGAALAIAALGSFIAGTLGILGLSMIAPALARLALRFGPPEYLAIGLAGLVLLANLTGGNPIKNWMMVLLGLILGTLGMDPISGRIRFGFGVASMASGIAIVPVTMGLFGIAELMRLIKEPILSTSVPAVRFRELYPNKTELKRATPAMVRGGIVGFLMGLIPGPATILSTFMSYTIEKRISKHPEEFGKGAVEGLAGPESANNAACSGALVPLLTLGFPFSAAPAMLLAGFMVHGVRPGPLFITQQSDLFWTLIGSMYLGNIFLLVLNLPLVGLFAKIASVPSRYMIPIVFAICVIGSYSEYHNLFGVAVMLAAGIFGYYSQRWGYSPTPLVVGLVISNILESAAVQTLLLYQGNLFSLHQRPIFVAIMCVAVVASMLPPLLRWCRTRARGLGEGLVPGQ